MKILVTGAGGQLGTEVCAYLRSLKYMVVGTTRRELDITNFKKVHTFIMQEKPDYVINCAALTDVAGCEKKIRDAYLINAVGPQNLASVCMDSNAVLVHISSDYVFDGKKSTPYLEFDHVNPLSIYGKSKLAGEQMIQALCPRHYIIRTSWLYGLNGKNFVKKVLDLAREYKEIRIVNDQRGTPTYTKDLAAALECLINTGAYGTYHVSNSGECTWYEFSSKIVELFQLETTVKPISSSELDDYVKRPVYSVLRNYLLELTGDKIMRPWFEALQDYVGEWKKLDR